MFAQSNRQPISSTASNSAIAWNRLSARFRALIAAIALLPVLPLSCFADHVHHLWYNNSQWQDQDLTALTGGGNTYGFDAITALYTTPNQQLHVYYVDWPTNAVHQLFFNGTTWSDQDLTALVGGPQAAGNGISGFAIGNLQYVFYVGLFDTHVHELSYNNSNWSDVDITSLAGGPSASFGNLVAFATKPNNQFHVYYPDGNGDLHQLYFNGSSWADGDLTAITGARCYGSLWISGFATGNLQHVFCPGYGGYSSNIDMLHIFYNNYRWTYEDITYRAGGLELPIYPGPGEAAFVVGNQGKVYGVTNDTHVHQFTFLSGHWSDVDLTSIIGAPQTSAPGAMLGFHTSPNNELHIYYTPSTGTQQYTDVYQLYFNGNAWSIQNLTGGAGQADVIGGMSGFAIGNQQHVFYLANGN